jgi:F-type H+-transporting ATPase subunit 8
MPQLVPFYFLNEITFAFTIIITLLYLFSKYILPRILLLFTSRYMVILLDEFYSSK